MKIKKISITDFRGLVGTLDLDFTGPNDNPLDLVVLAGPNGCGKTSILEACILALGYNNLLGQRGQPQFNIRSGCNNYEIVITAADNNREFTIRASNRGPLDVDYIAAAENPLTGLKQIRKEFLPTLDYFASWRKPGVLGPVPVKIGHGVSGIGNDGEYRLRVIKETIALLQAARNLDKDDEKRMNDFFAGLNRSWQYFYPNQNMHFKIDKQDKDISKGINIFIEKTGLGVMFPIDNMSSGELDVFTLLAALSLNDYSNGIIFIDEPELHLHSAWHRIILRTLRELLPTTQIICATHSNEIIDSVYSYERFTMLPENDPRIRLTKRHA